MLKIWIPGPHADTLTPKPLGNGTGVFLGTSRDWNQAGLV